MRGQRDGWFSRVIAAGIITTAAVSVPVVAGAEPITEPDGIAEPDSANTSEDGAYITIDVLSNDAPGAVITAFEDGEKGVVGEVLVGGVRVELTYTPFADLNGLDSFTYTVQSADGLTVEEETVEVNIAATSDAPEANDDALPQIGSPAITEGDPALDITEFVLDNDLDVDGDAFTITQIGTTGTLGTVELVDGVLTYEASSDAALTDSFVYQITDDSVEAESAWASVDLTIIGVDDAPVAEDDLDEAIVEGATALFNVLDNDTDVDGGDKFVATISEPSLGSAVIDPETGAISYTAPDEIAEPTLVSIGYTLNGESTANLQITVMPVDDLPVAEDDEATVAENGLVSIDVLDNDDEESDGGELSFGEITIAPSIGEAVYNSDTGLVDYTHSGDALDDVTFAYSVNGGDEATVTVTVTNDDDDAPVVDDVEAEFQEDGPAAVIPILEVGETDIDGESLAITSIGETLLGSATLIDGEVVYTPNLHANGEEIFTVVVTDGSGDDDIEVNVNVTIEAINDAPVANNDNFQNSSSKPDSTLWGLTPHIVVLEDQGTYLPVLANDEDVDSVDLQINLDSITISEEIGSVSLDEGQLLFTPAEHWNGYFSFTYTINDGELDSDPATVWVRVINTIDPTVALDDEVSVDEDDVVTVDVLDNDYDRDDLGFSIVDFEQPENGFVALAGNRLRVEPDPNFEGELEIGYWIQADADPYIDYYGHSVRPCGFDFDDFLFLPFGVETLLEEDSDAYPCDWAYATLTVTVENVNDGPKAESDYEETDEDESVWIPVLDNDSDVDGDELSIWKLGNADFGTVEVVDGGVLYTPDADAHGEDSFAYFVTDGDQTAVGTVEVLVESINDDPTAEDVSLETDEDVAIQFNLEIDDVDDDELTVSQFLMARVAGPGWSVSVEGTTITFTPDDDWFGLAEFPLFVSDNKGGFAVASVEINVVSVNDLPTGGPAAVGVDEDSNVKAAPDLNDVEDELVLSIEVDAAKGSTEITEDGFVLYTPNPDAVGNDSFTVRGTDSDGKSALSVVTVVIEPQNDAPVAKECGPLALLSGASVDISVIACAEDVDGDSLTLVSESSSSKHGSIEESSGALAYTADADQVGSDTVSFSVTDGEETVEVSIDITVTAPPAPEEEPEEEEEVPEEETEEEEQVEEEEPVVVPSPYVGLANLEGQVVRVYSAMLGRNPDESGFGWWVEQREAEMSLEEMIAKFADSPEFKSIYGDRIKTDTNDEWIDFVYGQIMGRTPETEGRAFWLAVLEDGSWSRIDMVIFFAESTEYKLVTQTS